MKRNIIHKGRKLNNISDPSLAKAHNEGAVVELVQIAVHKTWGRYVFIHFRRYGYILQESLDEYKKAVKIKNKINAINIDEKTKQRFIDHTLTYKLELASLKYFVLSKIGIEHLIQEYSLALIQIKKHRSEEYTPPREQDSVVEKLKIMKSALNINTQVPSELIKIFGRRDIAEHPKSDNLYNCSDQEWKNVNLAWVLSEEFDNISEPIVKFINEFIQTMEKLIKENPIPGTLTGVKRGIKAGEQYKKP